MDSIKTYCKIASFGAASSINFTFTDAAGSALECNYIKIFAASGAQSTADNFEVYFSGINSGFTAKGASIVASTVGPYTISGGATTRLQFSRATTGTGTACLLTNTTIFDGITPRSAQTVADYLNTVANFSGTLNLSATSDNEYLRVTSKSTGSAEYVRFITSIGTFTPPIFAANTSAYGYDASASEPIRNDLVAASLAVKVSGQKPTTVILSDSDRATGIKVAKQSGIGDRLIYVVYGVVQSNQNSMAFRGINTGS